VKTQLLLMTSIQSPTLWRGFTFGGHIDRYCDRTANIRPCRFGMGGGGGRDNHFTTGTSMVSEVETNLLKL